MKKYIIDRKERVTLGGLKQTIHIWSADQRHPVLLFLHGGPGVPNRHGIAKRHLDLTDSFTVAAWDQRKTWFGLSAPPTAPWERSRRSSSACCGKNF